MMRWVLSCLLLLLALPLAGRALAVDVDMKGCATSATSSECVPANPYRTQIELRNADATVVSVCSTVCPATLTNGFPLPVNGAAPWREVGGDFARGRICCITPSGSGKVAWREGALTGKLTAPTPTPVPTPTP